MITIKKQYNTVVSQAKKGVTGFANAYAKFIEKVTINGLYTLRWDILMQVVCPAIQPP